MVNTEMPVYSSSRMYTLAFVVVVVRELDVSSMEYTTRRVKTELIIITILHIIIITTSILNLGFKTIAPRVLAHTNA
jgi:hypothetical protein